MKFSNPLPCSVLAKALSFLFISFLLVPLGCTKSSQPNFFLGGIQVNEPDHSHWMQSLQGAKMNTVAVTVYAHQGDWNSENLWFDATNESVINEIRTAKANNLNVVLIMRVALDHAFKKNEFLWHGMIQPKSEAALAEWFKRYQKFVLTWARIAQAEGVDVFGIGSEMNSLTSTTKLEALPPLHEYFLDAERQRLHQERIINGAPDVAAPHLLISGGKHFKTLAAYLKAEEAAKRAWANEVSFTGDAAALEKMNARRSKLEAHWRSLIKSVRTHYKGALTYASNFDQFDLVTFWSELDYMGVNAYFSLREEYSERRDEAALGGLIKDSWRTVLGQIDAIRTQQGVGDMPLIFTELGFTHRANSTLEPWAMDGFSVVKHGTGSKTIIWREQERDLEERTIALRALQQANAELEKPFLRGILYWKLSTIESHIEIEPFVHILGSEEDKEFAKVLQSFL